MIDTTTRKPVSVSSDGEVGPYVFLPLEQLEKAKALLDTNKVSYWIDEEVISFDGKPEVAVINFKTGTSQVMVQGLLDSIP